MIGGNLCRSVAALALLIASTAVCGAADPWVIVVHGGAGGLPTGLPDSEIAAVRAALSQALAAGGKVLADGGDSLDAVQAAIRLMEDSGVLNAGRGAVLNHAGFAELDASLMRGSDRAAGAVAAVRHVANPIDLARLVMDRSPHVLLVGEGAEQFAREQGIALKTADYFITPRRQQEWRRAIEAERRAAPAGSGTQGTVGAVALDSHGNLAAGTSTGGLTNKHVGRVGDSPLIGAGTYAENGVCAVSATGEGETFIRYTAAAELCARLSMRGEKLATAAPAVIDELHKAGGDGGIIALDRHGQIATPYSTPTMLRGWWREGSAAEVVVEVGKVAAF
jgi:beta-aspartyl-peptidase (threonine type)